MLRTLDTSPWLALITCECLFARGKSLRHWGEQATFYKYFKDSKYLGLVIPSGKIGGATFHRIEGSIKDEENCRGNLVFLWMIAPFKDLTLKTY